LAAPAVPPASCSAGGLPAPPSISQAPDDTAATATDAAAIATKVRVRLGRWLGLMISGSLMWLRRRSPRTGSRDLRRLPSAHRRYGRYRQPAATARRVTLECSCVSPAPGRSPPTTC